MYDAMENGIYRAGFNGVAYETMSYGLIPVTAPFSMAALIYTSPAAMIYTNSNMGK